MQCHRSLQLPQNHMSLWTHCRANKYAAEEAGIPHTKANRWESNYRKLLKRHNVVRGASRAEYRYRLTTNRTIEQLAGLARLLTSLAGASGADADLLDDAGRRVVG
jgi:hypothetical protein